jgi:hypothetical protein
MLLKIGKSFEMEMTWSSMYIRAGMFERFYNRTGLSSGAESR